MDHQVNKQIKFDTVSPLQFIYEQISVDARIQKEVHHDGGQYKKQKITRRILQQCSGKFSPQTVTAILGPSGSGKTTMLNLLSGRLLSKNLTLKGRIKINGQPVETMADYKSVIGYVMQEDFMLPTFTPRQTFRFIADMRLPFKTAQQKDALVENIILQLGLKNCSETYVGNSLIRGVSGGEKKRTSIGVQLLINPSLIFLDEPTTGLDSTTALNLIKFLNKLAHSGRTVVTTIHQPSSQIFLQFDKIILMLDGNIVYDGKAAQSIVYFSKLGMPVPIHSNPMDHYMKLMNKQGITLRYINEGKKIIQQEINKQFDQSVQFLVKQYKSQVKTPQIIYTNQIIKEGHQSSWFFQMLLIIKRSVINELRNPLGIKAKIFQNIFFAVLAIILYEKQAQTLDSYLQNMTGLLFFIVMKTSFAGIFGSMNIFSQQRPVFIRQRLSNTYRTSSYFIGRSVAYLPLQLILPVFYTFIFYYVVHLETSGGAVFITIASSWLATWMSSAYGLLLSTAFSDPEVALSFLPVLLVPLMLVGGFYAQNMPDFFRIFQYISSFKYHYQTIVYGQFFERRNGWTINIQGNSYKYRGDILGENGQLYFDEPFWLSMLLMGLIGLVIRILSLIALYVISSPKPIKLTPPDTIQVQVKTKTALSQEELKKIQDSKYPGQVDKLQKIKKEVGYYKQEMFHAQSAKQLLGSHKNHGFSSNERISPDIIY